MQKYRSIVITLPTDDAASTSDIAFMQRLGDLRERFPTWSIRGITHRNMGLFPERPRKQTKRSNAIPTDHVHGRADLRDTQVTATPQFMSDVDDDVPSLESTGNVIGAAPCDVQVGLQVRLVNPPYEGSTGHVTRVRDENRFQVTLHGSGVSWWCTSDDVVVIALPNKDGSDEPGGVSPEEVTVDISTLKRVKNLEERNRQLELELEQLRTQQQKT